MAEIEKEHQARLDKLFKKREKLHGYKILTELESLNRTYFIVEHNFDDLMEYIKKCQNELIFEIFENGQIANNTKLETLRLLHNYLSSIQSLIDHIRKTNKNIDSNELNEYYEDEMIKFSKNNLVIFIKNFRNYIQHFKIPLLAQQFHISKLENQKVLTMEDIDARNAKFEFNTFLNKKELLKWDRWNRQSITYIKKYIGKKELKTIISEYQNMNSKHYEDFCDKVYEIYKKEIDIVYNINVEIDNL